MGLSLVALGQGIPFFHAGDELLRSKSLDRNSYNSGDWFNRLDFSYESNNWGVGLPPAGDNQDKWPVLKPLLGNPALKPSSAHITRALDHFEEMLAIRKSADLFRLRTAEDIQAKVRFLNTGSSQLPGLIVMNLRDELAADGITDIVVLFNANDEQQEFSIPEYEGGMMELHPVLRSSTDALVRGSLFVAPTGTFIVPGRTTAVFVNVRTSPTDGGVSDGGTAPDAGTVDGDAGTDPEPGDAGTGVDAGTDPEPADSGTTTDAGVEPLPDDAGTTSDAGTQTDAGTTPGTDAGIGNGGGNDSGGGCGGCAGTGGEAFSALTLLLGGVLRSRRRRRA
jgi:hypothetical protein